MGDYRRLTAWQVARDIAVEVYRLTASFPASEQFGLTTQMRRAAISVSSNIAEGSGRGSSTAFHAYIRIARGSAHELQSQLDIACRLGFLDVAAAAGVVEQLERVSQLMSGIIRVRRGAAVACSSARRTTHDA